MSEFSVEPIRPSQVPAAVALIQESMPNRLLKFMIYGQHGIADFISSRVAHSDESRKSQILVVPGVGDEVVACAEFTFPPTGIPHLAYLAVATQMKGRGIATCLIKDFLRRHHDIGEMDLNVFVDNEPARSLYHRLGFVEMGKSAWRVRDLPQRHGNCQIRDLAESRVLQARFGFSQFHVDAPGGWTKFGRLGDDVVQSYSAESFDDDALLGAIRAVFPESKKVFYVDGSPETTSVTRRNTVLARSIRMRLPLAIGVSASESF